MKLKIVAIVFLYGFLNCFGQNFASDTLRCYDLYQKIEAEADDTISKKYNNQLCFFVKQLKIKYKSNKELLVIKKYEVAYLINYGYFDLMDSKIQLSLNCYYSALKIAEKINSFTEICTIYNSIGSIFDDLGDKKKALYYYRKVAILGLKHNKEKNVGTANNNIGVLYGNLDRIDSSYFYFKKSLTIREKLKDSLNIMQTIANIGGIYRRTKKYPEAIRNYKSCLEYELKIKDEIGAFSSLHNLAGIYFDLKDYKKAAYYSEKSLLLSKKNNYLVGILNASERLATVYKYQNRLNDVIHMLHLKEITKDSINTNESKEYLLKAEFKYETEKKEAQIKSLSQQKKIATLESQRQKTIALVLGIAIISILITSYVLFNRYKIKKQNENLKSQLIQAEKAIEAEKKATESELKALKSQMNPHFIFNALNGIQEQFMYGDKVVANEQMGNFTALTRQILSVSGKKAITIANEIDLLTKYLELEKMRFETGFEYAISCSEKVDQDYDAIPPMIIQPFAENAIKQGLLHKLGDKKLSIFFDLLTNEDYLLCTISDNGVGRQKSAEIKAKSFSKHESFSTQSISQRLDILKKEGVDDELVVYENILDNDNLVVGTIVLVRIPVA